MTGLSNCLTLFVLLFFLSVFPVPITAKYASGTLSSVSSWTVLERFCFLPVSPEADMNDKEQWKDFRRMEMKFKFAKNQRLTLLIYWGDFGEWLDIYRSSYSKLSCSERNEKAKFKINLWQNDTFVLKPHNETHVASSGVQHFFAMRANFFFITLSNCDPDSEGSYLDGSDDFYYSQGSIDVDYESLLTNGATPNSMHYSADEIGIFDATITYFILYSVLLVISYLIGVALRNRKKLHVTVKVLLYSVLCQFCGLFFLLVNLGYFSDTGINRRGLQIFSYGFFALADTMMVILLVLLAKGWTIVRRKISVPGRVKLGVFGTIYFTSTLFVVAWRFKEIRDDEVLYFYQSPPGVMFWVVRVLAVVWFNYAAVTTRRQFKTKRRFYKKFVFIFT